MNTFLPWRTAATALLLGATLTAAYLSEQRSPEDLAKPLDEIPRQIEGWAGRDGDRLDEQTEQVLQATSYLSRTYRKGADWVQMFIAFYSMQRAGEAMHSPRNCLPGGGWEIWKYENAELDVAGRAVTVNKYYIQKGQSRLVTYYWYQSSDRIVANEYVAKVCLVWDALFKGRTSGSIVRVTAPDTPQADAAAEAFAAELIPEVDRVLPENGA